MLQLMVASVLSDLNDLYRRVINRNKLFGSAWS